MSDSKYFWKYNFALYLIFKATFYCFSLYRFIILTTVIDLWFFYLSIRLFISPLTKIALKSISLCMPPSIIHPSSIHQLSIICSSFIHHPSIICPSSFHHPPIQEALTEVLPCARCWSNTTLLRTSPWGKALLSDSPKRTKMWVLSVTSVRSVRHPGPKLRFKASWRQRY